jgi:hypothetical protein
MLGALIPPTTLVGHYVVLRVLEEVLKMKGFDVVGKLAGSIAGFLPFGTRPA